MEKSSKKLTFNRKAVGEITRSGGFSALVKEAEAGGITVLYKFNEPVAIILPCDRTVETAYEAAAGAGVFVADALKNNTPEGLMERFFRSLIESAALAKLMLGVESGNVIEKELMKAFEEKFQKSSAQDKALSSHDNLSGVVPKVKQEGLPIDGSPSVSRKRSKPRKTEVSPLPKAKIGTKREKSA